MQQSDHSALASATTGEVAPVETVDEPDARGKRRSAGTSRRGLPDGVKAALYVLAGIFLAAFIIGIWPLLEVLQSKPIPGS